MHAFIFTVIVIVFSLPFGLYNYFVNGTYVISSNGAGYQFYLGNTEAGYLTIVNVPEKGSVEFEKMEDICRNAGYINGSESKYNSILNQPQKIKQKVFYKEAINWIKLNPMKFVILKLYDALFFLFPGVSFRHYNFFKWITSFIVCAPIYILAYISIYRRCRNNFSKHAWILYLFISMLIFSTVWYVQNRFRTITLEPFYIIYASVYLYQALKSFSFGKNMIVFLDYMFLRYLQSIQVKKIFFGI
jgi:hypothetical protein